jgi:hypothetical protein
MNLIDLIPFEMKRVGAKDGGEYHGPCPLCGGTDRFHVWPGQGDHGTWWCRGCSKGGDAIQYLRDVEGMGYKQACQRLGVEAKELDPLQVPPVKPVSGFTPSDSVAPADKWAGKAGNFVTHCQQALLENKTACQWLAERGIDQKTAEKYRLGWNGKDFWRDRTAWGLPEELKPDGKPKKLWIPAGLVIPWSVAGRLHRLRIRRPEGEPRYYVVPGSGRSPMISRPDAAAYVVVESELDAILLDSLASDLVGIIAQGNSTAKPDQATWQPLQQAVSIMVALDTDEAGAKASVWWKQQLSTATRWPIVGGKDPGDAYKAGIDLRAWITAGLPPALKVKPAASCLQPATPPPAPPKATVTVATIAGHSIHITDDQATWRKLMDEGQTAYSNHELQRLAQAVQLADEHADHTKEIIMTAKEIFGGYILKTEALS